MSNYINNKQIESVLGLLKNTALSQRDIAKLSEVSRGSVALIKRNPNHYRNRRKQTMQEKPPFSGPSVRCPDCGAKVMMPCFECSMLQRKKVG